MHQIGPHVATTGLRLVLLLTCAFSQADDRAHSVASIVADGRVNMTKDELIDHYRERYPLIYAAGEADHSTLKALIAQGADVNVRSADGETALHLNAIKGDSFTTKLLLAAGAEVDARTPEAPTRKHKGPMMWATPLMWAVYGGTPQHVEMMKLLLAAGADPLAADETGKSVLQMAQEAQASEEAEVALVSAIHKQHRDGSADRMYRRRLKDTVDDAHRVGQLVDEYNEQKSEEQLVEAAAPSRHRQHVLDAGPREEEVLAAHDEAHFGRGLTDSVEETGEPGEDKVQGPMVEPLDFRVEL